MEYLQYSGKASNSSLCGVLNLVISGIPSIPVDYTSLIDLDYVLNLVISGIPSIQC